MESSATAIFCNAIREYARRIGKHNFFIFGEIVADDATLQRYLGRNSRIEGTNERFPSLDAALDFPLYFILEETLKGFLNPALLRDRYDRFKTEYADHGEAGQYFVTFVDNHDQMARPFKRFMNGVSDWKQAVLAIGSLLCNMGIPCIYYGTEQGFSGEGEGDEFIREALFDLDDPKKSLLNQNCAIYKGISKIAGIFREHPALRFGRMYFREVSEDGRDFALPDSQPCTLAFSRILADQEVLIAYNTSTTETRNDYVIVDNSIQKEKKTLSFLYGKDGTVPIQEHPYPGNESLFIANGRWQKPGSIVS